LQLLPQPFDNMRLGFLTGAPQRDCLKKEETARRESVILGSAVL
jgi:hypothetical protein